MQVNVSVAGATRVIGLRGASLVAWAVYSLGLVAPLTPSEGLPGVWQLALFAGLPLLVLGIVAAFGRGRTARALAWTQLALMAGFSLRLLALQARIW